MCGGTLPIPRRATRVVFRNQDGEQLDDGLVLWFPGPASVTGEDLAEFHIHGGRAVIDAVEKSLTTIPGLRPAEAGEFTKRAFINGRIDLAEAEGLADLLTAETELQRRSAMNMANGLLSGKLEGWRKQLLHLSAQVEAILDFDGEEEVSIVSADLLQKVDILRTEIATVLAFPSAEVLREGFRVALAGPPNVGKSTLFNALTDSEAAITTPIAGTTRDVLTRAVSLRGVPFTFVDMAGVHEDALDPVERIGITRAHSEIAKADVVLWLGDWGSGPKGAWEIEPQIDLFDVPCKPAPMFRVSAHTGEGVSKLVEALIAEAQHHMPKPNEVAISRRQAAKIVAANRYLEQAGSELDVLLLAEHLRLCRVAFDTLLGRTSTEEVLDELFGRFCIGK